MVEFLNLFAMLSHTSVNLSLLRKSYTYLTAHRSRAKGNVVQLLIFLNYRLINRPIRPPFANLSELTSLSLHFAFTHSSLHFTHTQFLRHLFSNVNVSLRFLNAPPTVVLADSSVLSTNDLVVTAVTWFLFHLTQHNLDTWIEQIL